MDVNFLLKIEQAALNAWPAPRQILHDGWLLRFAGGPSKRVNSVTPFYPSSLPLAENISVCETIYASQGLPCLFRISDLVENENLKHGIKAVGYTPFDPTFVLGRSLVMNAERQPNVTVLEMPLEDWFRMRSQFVRVPAADQQVHGAILKGIVPEKVLMGLFYEGQPVACGMGVAEGSLLGFFSIYTDARWRRKGYAGMIMSALTTWGIEHGATYGYLQVEGDNSPALALYDWLGFERCYPYTYYMKAQGE